MRIGVVIPCYRQERWLPRTVTAIERALAGRDWSGVLVRAATGDELPELSERWRVLAPPTAVPLTPGAARMLGFAACGGEWVLFVDADVAVQPAWLERALVVVAAADAAREPLGGCFGRLEEWFEEARGVRPGSRDLYRVGDRDRDVRYLATLAFYSREALTRAGGYDPRLQSEEDFELGLRFQRLGLRLRSLAPLAGQHWSEPRPSFGELSRRWRTGLCFGQGQVLRLYLGKPGFWALLARQSLYLATLWMWAIGLWNLVGSVVTREELPFVLWLPLPLAVLGVMAVRKRSFRLALHSLLTWTLNGAGLIVGLFRMPRGSRPGEAPC
jgi:glycosyltransferase involved in cell wall biosynthesis